LAFVFEFVTTRNVPDCPTGLPPNTSVGTWVIAMVDALNILQDECMAPPTNHSSPRVGKTFTCTERNLTAGRRYRPRRSTVVPRRTRLALRARWSRLLALCRSGLRLGREPAREAETATAVGINRPTPPTRRSGRRNHRACGAATVASARWMRKALPWGAARSRARSRTPAAPSAPTAGVVRPGARPRTRPSP